MDSFLRVSLSKEALLERIDFKTLHASDVIEISFF